MLFSAAVLLGVTASLVDLASEITGVCPRQGSPSAPSSGSPVLRCPTGSPSPTTSTRTAVHPLTVPAVFIAKSRAFLLLGPLVGLAFYALAWRGAPVLEALVGAVLIIGIACCIFGTTVYLTWLSERVPLRHGAVRVFGAATIVPFVLVLVVGFALTPISTDLLAALGAGGVGLGVIGLSLYHRSLPKWTARYRQD